MYMPYLIAELHEVVLFEAEIHSAGQEILFHGSQRPMSKYFAALAQFWWGHTSSYAVRGTPRPGSSVTEMLIIYYLPKPASIAGFRSFCVCTTLKSVM
jgi:hypothetical protein